MCTIIMRWYIWIIIKNRIKDRPKSNAERRKIDPKNNADLGISDGKKIGAPPHKEKDHL